MKPFMQRRMRQDSFDPPEFLPANGAVLSVSKDRVTRAELDDRAFRDFKPNYD